ncbi:MAG: hypothetical protein LBS12_06645 [Prevotellaceae bacterium]|jgi:hypothetical protein|nr:hypothetical protein [Prevotellaceae bacterium]
MSHYNSYFPRKDGAFLPFAGNIRDKSKLNLQTWHLDTDQVTILDTDTTNAYTAYDANVNPETSNRRTATNKKRAFSDLRHYLRFFTDSFYVNEYISDSDIEAMGLRPRHPHAHEPLPVPGDAPIISDVISQHHTVIIYVANPLQGHPVQHLVSAGYYGFIIRYRKEDETEWMQDASTKLHYSLYFDADDATKHLHFMIAWINPRMQPGPWCDEQIVLIT